MTLLRSRGGHPEWKVSWLCATMTHMYRWHSLPEGALHCLQTLRASENLLVQLDAWPSSQDTIGGSESVCVRLFGLYSFPEMDQLLLQENVFSSDVQLFLMVEPEPATALFQDRINHQLGALDQSFFDRWGVDSQSPRYRNEQGMVNSS